MNDLSISLDGLKGWGGWSLFFLAVIWYIRGAPDRRRALNEGDADLRDSYGELISSLSTRIDNMQLDHERDRNSWMQERVALRNEYEEDRRRWNAQLAQERKERTAERDQWRRERSALMDQVEGLERKLKSYGSSVTHLESEGVNAPTVTKRLIMAPVDDQGDLK